MITLQNKTKYYKITSTESFNLYSGNFYRILRIIGFYNKGTHNSCIKHALKLVRKKVRDKGQHRCSNTEVKNLIQAKHRFKFREAKKSDKIIVYKLSQKSDLILKSIFELFEKAKNDKKFDHTKFYGKHIVEGEFCRIQMVYAIDDKLDQILKYSPSKHRKNVSRLREKIRELRTEC